MALFAVFAFLIAVQCKSGADAARDERKADVARVEKAFDEYVQALPDLRVVPKDREVQLIVDYVEDPSLPTLSASELARFFRETETQTRALLGYRVRFMIREKHSMESFFAGRQSNFDHPVLSFPVKAWYLDPDASETPQAVTRAIGAAMEGKSEDVIKRYFGPMQGTKEEYLQGITSRFFDKLHILYAERDLNGRPLLDKESLSARRLSLSFPHWDAAALQEADVDFIVCNTVMAGPDASMPLYVINRGGVTTAFVENNKHRPYQASGVFGLYPFLSTGSYFQKERGAYPRQTLLDAAAVVFVHELGHFLLRKAENYTLDGSVHRAPRDLHYVEWAQEVKAKHKAIKEEVPAVTKY